MTLETAVEEEGTDPLAVGMRNPGGLGQSKSTIATGESSCSGEPIITEETVYPGVGGGERNRPPTVGEERRENSAGRGSRLSRAIVLLAEAHEPAAAEADVNTWP